MLFGSRRLRKTCQSMLVVFRLGRGPACEGSPGPSAGSPVSAAIDLGRLLELSMGGRHAQRRDLRATESASRGRLSEKLSFGKHRGSPFPLRAGSSSGAMSVLKNERRRGSSR